LVTVRGPNHFFPKGYSAQYDESSTKTPYLRRVVQEHQVHSLNKKEQNGTVTADRPQGVDSHGPQNEYFLQKTPAQSPFLPS